MKVFSIIITITIINILGLFIYEKNDVMLKAVEFIFIFILISI